MKNTGFEFPKSYFENRKTIRFFFEGQSVEGFLFCVSNYVENKNYINQSILEELGKEGKKIGLFTLEWNEEAGPIAQFQKALETHPDGLILNNLDDLIEKTNSEVITTLNYAREGLLALGKPILCWLTEAHYSRFIKLGADLYSRRSFSTLYFEDLNLSMPHGLMESRFSEQTLSEEETIRRKQRLQLLERQLKEAEQSSYPAEKIAKELVFDLLDEYRELQMPAQIEKLIKKYETHFKELSFENQNILGKAYLEINQLEKAKPILEDLVKTAELSLGPDNKLIPEYQNNLAIALANLGGQANLLQAKDLLERALARQMEHFGESVPEVAISQSNLAFIFQDLGGKANLLRAKELLKKALAIQIHYFGENAPKVATVQSNLATVLRDLGGEANLLRAKSLLEKALETDIQFFGENATRVALRQLNLGGILAHFRHLPASLELFEKSYTTFYQTMGPDHEHTQNAKQWLDGVKEAMGGEG